MKLFRKYIAVAVATVMCAGMTMTTQAEAFAGVKEEPGKGAWVLENEVQYYEYSYGDSRTCTFNFNYDDEMKLSEIIFDTSITWYGETKPEEKYVERFNENGQLTFLENSYMYSSNDIYRYTFENNLIKTKYIEYNGSYNKIVNTEYTHDATHTALISAKTTEKSIKADGSEMVERFLDEYESNGKGYYTNRYYYVNENFDKNPDSYSEHDWYEKYDYYNAANYEVNLHDECAYIRMTDFLSEADAILTKDANGNITSVLMPEGVPYNTFENMKYDANGNLISMDNCYAYYKNEGDTELYRTNHVSITLKWKYIEAKKDPEPSVGTSTVKAGDKLKTNGITYIVSKPVSSKTKIGEVIFSAASKSSTQVVIPDTVTVNGRTYRVTEIKANAFKNNKKLKSVTIGKNIKKIGKNAFYGCKNLKTIRIKTSKLTKKNVGKNAFAKINKKANALVPKKKVKSYKGILKARGFKSKSQKVIKMK